MLVFQLSPRDANLDAIALGATQGSFAEAATVLERLTLVHVSPNRVRDATEQLGAVLVADQEQHATAAQDGHARPPAMPSPERLYITMDGVLAHLQQQGWSELKVGCCYQTHTRPQLRRPEHMDIRAHHASYVTALTDAETFGWHLWQAAARRGVVAAKEVVVRGAGAHWIWNIADLHFPHATQIVDWYHASQERWNAAAAIWGEASPQRVSWAQARLDDLWDGKVDAVRAALEPYREVGDAVVAALSYYTTHQARMDDATDRARGLQIGSGSVESACKQLVSARLKQAGMMWDAPGAAAVATVRAWLKGDRWREAMALRPAPSRGYQRQPPRGAQSRSTAPSAHAALPALVSPPGAVPRPTGLSPEVLAQVRAALAHAPAQHPWRKPWSKRQQRAQHKEQPRALGPIATA